MAEFPALPLFTDAYLADTRHLTTEEHGAYLLLLMCAWRTRGCALKDDDRQLARIAGVSPTKWRRLRPALTEFFSVTGGVWKQKKLTYVHENVSKKVARNRQNGARGGRATAAKQRSPGQGKQFEAGWQRAYGARHGNENGCDTKSAFDQGSAGHESIGCENTGQESTPHERLEREIIGHNGDGEGSERSSGCHPNADARAAAAGDAKTQATKTKTKTKTKASSSNVYGRTHKEPAGGFPVKTLQTSRLSVETLPTMSRINPARPAYDTDETNRAAAIGFDEGKKAAIAAATSLKQEALDTPTMTLWHAAGADIALDVLPVLEKIAKRELHRTGKRPLHLAYYSEAVLEARDQRLGATRRGAAYASANPAKPSPVVFQKNNVTHWKQFLGDPKSKFRGDYLSRNWHIPNGHPDFKTSFLGAEPKQAVNSTIPAEIYAAYGPGWGWLLPPEK